MVRPYRGLMLDNIVGSLPELGPSVPDGGFLGYIVLAAIAWTQILLSGFVITYGVLIVNVDTVTVVKVWDSNVVVIPILFYVFWILTDPWSRTLISLAEKPRAVAICGVLFLSAGVLASSFTISIYGDKYLSNLLPGILSGIGASLLQEQSETILKKYYRLKLPLANCVLNVAMTVGRIMFPLIVNTLLNRSYSVRETMIIYAAIVLQTLVAVVTYQTPKLQQSTTTDYSLLEENDDEEEIYSNGDGNQRSNHVSSESNNAAGSAVVDVHAVESAHEDIGDLNVRINRTRSEVMSSFTQSDNQTYRQEFRNDLDRIERYHEENEPRPLFSDIELNQTNVSFAFDNNQNITNDTNNMLAYPSPLRIKTNYIDELKLFVNPKFYMCLLLAYNDNISSLIFWLFLPINVVKSIGTSSYSSSNMVQLIALTSVGSFCSSMLVPFEPKTAHNRTMLLCGFCAVCSIGFYVLSCNPRQVIMLLASVCVSFGLTGSSNLLELLLTNTLGRPVIYKAHTLICSLTAVGIIASTFTHNITVEKFYFLISLLQMFTSAIWITNLFMHKIKQLFRR